MVRLPHGTLPAFFWTLSALTYPVFLVLGVRIEWLGISPVLAEIFAACAIVSVGGGLRGMALDTLGRAGRPLVRGGYHRAGVADSVSACRSAAR
jgi:hypothetical protein